MAGSRIYATSGTASIGNVNVYDVNADPNGTVAAPIGSLAVRRTAGSVNFYQNVNGATAAADAIWDLLPAGASAVAQIAMARGELVTYQWTGAASMYVQATNITTQSAFRVDGVVLAPVLNPADTAYVHRAQGKAVPILFAAPPAAASNGSMVFLGQTGFATLTPPSATLTTIVEIGILVGANGVTSVPLVVFNPHIVGSIA
jgi:hypothetical protein